MNKKLAVFKDVYMLISQDCGHTCDIGTYETRWYIASYDFCTRGCAQTLTTITWKLKCWTPTYH